MEIIYRKLERNDLAVFIQMRMNQLQEEGAKPTFDLAPALYEYYTKHLNNHTFVSWLAVAGETIVGSSGMSYIERPPYYSNPSGKVGMLSSMYTLREYRRQGIAKELLSKVINEAREYGCHTVQISASDMGMFLYEEFGFKRNKNYLQYVL